MKIVRTLFIIAALVFSAAAYAERVETDGPNRTVIYKDNGNVTILDGNTQTVENYTAEEWKNSKEPANYDLEAVIKELGVKNTNGNMVVELADNALFFSGSHTINNKAAETLKKIAFLINHSRKGNVYIYGHAEADVKETDKKELSQSRADAVAYWLNVRGGVARDVMKAEAAKQNSNIEIVIEAASNTAPAPVPTASPEYKPSVISTCSFPLGKYKYLFSDGYQAYYFSKEHTIYVNPEGKQIVKKGDFKLKASVSTYERIGDRFIYTNPAGVYTSVNGGEITYKPSAVAAQIAQFTNTFSDEFGSYKKQGGKIIFTPKRKLPDLEVTESNCGMVQTN